MNKKLVLEKGGLPLGSLAPEGEDE